MGRAVEGVDALERFAHWLTAISFVVLAVIIGHIYIGSLGMEGALDAMTHG